MQSIPANQLVSSIPSVLSAGGNPLSLNAVFLTQDRSIPIGTAQEFPDAPSVEAWFGAQAVETGFGNAYFGGFVGANQLPGTLYFVQYNEAAVAGYLRGASLATVTLAQLQTLSGVLMVAIDGETVTSANINLATANSFTNAAGVIQPALQT